MSTSDDALLQTPMAKSLLSAGVPRDEVLANLRTTASAGSSANYVAPPSEGSTEPAPMAPIRAQSFREPLPDGWEERFDPSSGRKFYIDFVNQTTSWTRPVAQGLTPRQSVSGLGSGDLPSSWQLEGVANSVSYPALTPVAPAEVAPAPAVVPAVPPAAEAAAAPRTAPNETGFFGKLFGRTRQPNTPHEAPAAGPSAPAVSGAVVHAIGHSAASEVVHGGVGQTAGSGTTAVAVQQQLAVVGMASAELSERLQALAQLGQVSQKLHQESASGAIAASDVGVLERLDDGTTALKLLDSLGSTSIPALQAALCRALWQLSEEEAVQRKITEAGGLLFVSALLGAQAAEVQQEAALLLLPLLSSDTACGQFASAEGIPPLLQLLHAPSSNLRLSSLELLAKLCEQGAADAVAAAGGAAPLSFELVKAAGAAKGWGGGSASDAAAGERVCGQVLSCLVAMPEAAVRDAFRAASATPALVALLGTANEAVRVAAMALMEKLAPADSGAMSEEMVASGGIALLCDNLLQRDQPEANRLQAMQTIATLSSKPVNAAAIADASGAVDELLLLLSSSADIAAAALSALSALSSLGALRLSHLRDPAALQGLTNAAAPDAPPEGRAAAFVVLAQAALDPVCRQGLAAQGAPSHLIAAIQSDAVSAAATSHATQALAQFAADETFRSALAGWGALAALCEQLSPATQPDSRTRAMALSAVANVSFVDAPALVAAGAAGSLVEVLFDSAAPLLRMALTAITNLLTAANDAPSVLPQLMQSGAVHALTALLTNPDTEISSQALTAVMQACTHTSLAAPLAEAGAAPAVVGLLRAGQPSSPAVRALIAMCATESARVSAVDAGAIPALCSQLLAGADASSRAEVAVALSEVLRGDWKAAYAAAGWPVLLALLQLGPSDSPQRHADISRLSAGLVAEDQHRAHLLPDPQAVHFLFSTLLPLVSSPPPSTPHDDALALALGLSHCLVALMASAVTDYCSEAAVTATKLAEHPLGAASLAKAGAAPFLVEHMQVASASASVGIARALFAMAEDDVARGAVMQAGAVGAMCHALLAAPDQDSRLSLSLILAKLLRGDWQAAYAAAGWPAVVAVLLAGAGSVSPAMRQLADGAGPEMIAALLQVPPAPAAGHGALLQPAAPQGGAPAPPPAAAALDGPAAATTTLRGPQKLRAADLD